jgi:hypothetical protein
MSGRVRALLLFLVVVVVVDVKPSTTNKLVVTDIRSSSGTIKTAFPDLFLRLPVILMVHAFVLVVVQC